MNRDSFLYHESDYFSSGLIGELKPLTMSMFGNHRVLESLEIVFDIDYKLREKLTSEQCEAYCRAFLLCFNSYAEDEFSMPCYVINRALDDVSRMSLEVSNINGIPNSWDSEPVRKLTVIVNMLKETVNMLNRRKKPYHYKLRIRNDDPIGECSIYDHIAKAMFEVIHNSAYIREPSWECWTIQHNIIFDGLFRDTDDGHAKKIVLYKLRRLIYNAVREMEVTPNYKGARILAFCLNVLGLKVMMSVLNEESLSLQIAILKWTTKNYSILHEKYPDVARSCLVEDISFDEKNNRIVKTYPANGLRKENTYHYLPVNP